MGKVNSSSSSQSNLSKTVKLKEKDDKKVMFKCIKNGLKLSEISDSKHMRSGKKYKLVSQINYSDIFLHSESVLPKEEKLKKDTIGKFVEN